MGGGDTLVYFLEEEAVSALLSGWPDDMKVAVCLSSEGGCDLAVHHRDEMRCVLDRIAALHHRRPDELFVTPQIEGHKTRKVLFSQEQQLLALVTDNPHLADMAAEYAINFRLAQERGGSGDATGDDRAQPEERLPHQCEPALRASDIAAPASDVQDERDTSTARTQRASVRRWSRRPVPAVVAALAAVMLVSGHFATARGSDPQTNAAVTMPDSGADAALELIAAMALADAVSWMPANRP